MINPLDTSSIPHEPNKKGPGNDPKCNGWGWLWEDSYGNRVTCWRCAGTGSIPNLTQPRAAGTISVENEGDEDEGVSL